MTENETKQSKDCIRKFLENIENKKRREEARIVLKIMQSTTRMQPKMWGDAVIGFGSYHYKYESGREGDSPLIVFSPRKQNLTIHLLSGVARHQNLLDKLGKHKTGKICLYINNLDNIDMPILRKIIKNEFVHMKKRHLSKK